MRAPRRVPWATKSELNELYDLIFSPDADARMKMKGLERMSIYISSPSCPAFMPILYALVAADLLPAPSNIIEAQSTRLSCAMAIVRLINGMVDPLQTGPYARPIAHLAATLHIPPSLISLRHRATHEDLPPLPLLRSSVLQCIAYLHTYSFLPLLAESSTQPIHVTPDRAMRLIARYKRVSKDKARDRDVDDTGHRAKQLRKIKRALEVEDTQDLVEALCTTEGLAPVARKKRPSSRDTEPTQASQQLWLPLIRHLGTYHPNMVVLLVQQIVGMMLEPMTAVEKDDVKEQTSFRWSLAVWLIWMWNAEWRDLHLNADVKEEIWAQLLPSLLRGTSLLRRLASCLADADPAVATGWFQLETMLPSDSHGNTGELHGLQVEAEPLPTEHASSLDKAFNAMQARMAQFEQMMSTRKTGETASAPTTEQSANSEAPGWRRMTMREWKPCPIGMFGAV